MRDQRADTFYFSCFSCGFTGDVAGVGFTNLGRTDADLARLPPNESTVSFTARRPNCTASRAVGVQMSIRLPLTEPPVSPTTYSPLKDPASSRTRVPRGKTAGSAAINPRLTGIPLAVRPRRL